MIDLETADSIRERDAERAFEAYRARRDALNPTDPRDADRILWLFRHMRRPDPPLEPLALWAAEDAFGRELRAEAQRIAGTFALERKDFRTAGARLRSCLDLIAGRGDDRVEQLACLNLAVVALNDGHELEALVLSQRAARIAQTDASRFYARLLMLSCFIEIGDWTRYEALVSELKALDVPPKAVARLRSRELDAAALRGDWKTALALANESDHSTRAIILALGGQADVALAEWRRAHRLGRPAREADRWRLAFARILSRPDPRQIARFVAALARAPLGSGRKADMAQCLARELGNDPVAQQCCAVASAARLTRLREIAEFTDRFPHLGKLDRTQRRILQDYRERLLADQPCALAAVEATVLRICTSCSRVEIGLHRWAPIEHFLPPSRFRLEPATCDDC